ncbi:hypothetical protein CP10139811_1474 [Chlamydia ibidis]|uniref:Uncharacterized protein n=1 Tax=Chlamydia ibidis TaxID=1405396 RepID=S7KGC3_9CHLA|nr:hypothetical protein CP10139811_1474 [Chlamydia ibidis]
MHFLSKNTPLSQDSHDFSGQIPFEPQNHAFSLGKSPI